MNLYPSEWKRLVASRLATLFDEQPSNPLIQRMASTLAGENWWTWSGDRELLPLLRRIEAHPPWTAWGLRAIERICFLRRQQAGLRRDRMTLRLGYSKDGIGVQFLFHRDRSGQIRRSDRQAFAIAGSVPVPGRGTIDVRRMAAAAWKARTHLVEPADLVRRRPTLGLVADHFNLKAWRVRYTAQKLLAQLERQLKQ